MIIQNRIKLCIPVFLIALLIFHGCETGPQVKRPSERGEFWTTSSCSLCHKNIFKQYSDSMHAKSFNNPVFKAQYFKEVLPYIRKDSEMIKEANGCISCHAPIAFLENNGYIIDEGQVNPGMSGVTCDFCHTIWDFEGDMPGNANYVSIPSNYKLGPFQREKTWHHVYSELHTKSEFCAICHNRVNKNGIEIMSTFTEWKNSRYAKKGIQCQDCHMNARGFLSDGRPDYESGKAAHMTVGWAPYREKLYSHRFPGAHAKKQVAGSLALNLKFGNRRILPGDEITINVIIKNSRTGHSMPSGSTELRSLLLDLKAHLGDRIISIPARLSGKENQYDILSKEESGYEILGDHIPKGVRVYRTIYVDKNGARTLSSFEAAEVVFDNRLNAGETRSEKYFFKLPENSNGEIAIEANLYYLPYPVSFAEKLDLPKPEAIKVSSIKETLQVINPH